MLFGALHGVAEASRLRPRKCRPASRLRRHLREARHNRNRLQANVVSAAGGKTAPVIAPEGRHCLKGNTI